MGGAERGGAAPDESALWVLTRSATPTAAAFFPHGHIRCQISS
jgi:hypothetical protein